MFCVLVCCLWVLEDVSQDFGHLDWMYPGWRHLGVSSIVFRGGVESGGVPEQPRLNTLENRRRQPERGFAVTCFTVPVTNLKVFPIRYT